MYASYKLGNKDVNYFINYTINELDRVAFVITISIDVVYFNPHFNFVSLRFTKK